jgi:hypothetical protein
MYAPDYVGVAILLGDEKSINAGRGEVSVNVFMRIHSKTVPVYKSVKWE